jgi:VWFA-related protein
VLSEFFHAEDGSSGCVIQRKIASSALRIPSHKQQIQKGWSSLTVFGRGRSMMRFHYYALTPAMRCLAVFAAASALYLNGQAANVPAPVDSAKPNLITLDVFAADSLGHPVHGLEQQNFTLLDNGQPRQLVNFRAVDPSSDPNAVRVLLVVDMMNNAINSVARQREQIGEFLNQDGGKLGYPMSMAILTESGVKMMNGYTQDGHALLDAFQKADSELRPVGRSAGFYGDAERLQESLSGLMQIAAFEAKQPGRKLVFLIGPGWPLLPNAGIQESDRQRAWVFNTLVQISNTMREAHMVLYSLDPFGLGSTQGNPNPFFYQSYRKPVTKVDQAEYPYLAQQLFAERSGGRALISANDTLGDINAALRDAGAYYELTFEAPAADRLNEYHKLEVRVDKPNVKVHTSAGYYAKPAPIGKITPPSKAPEPEAGLPKP